MNQYNFIVTDNKNNLQCIIHWHLLPDLFKEEQGVVIEGNAFKKQYNSSY